LLSPLQVTMSVQMLRFITHNKRMQLNDETKVGGPLDRSAAPDRHEQTTSLNHTEIMLVS
jgi:hypothetical protein